MVFSLAFLKVLLFVRFFSGLSLVLLALDTRCWTKEEERGGEGKVRRFADGKRTKEKGGTLVRLRK